MAKELYAGHLPYEVTEEDIRRIFSVAGVVTSVHIITDPATGRSKGCAYVRMSDDSALKEAIECLDGAMIDGRVISVSIARPQKTDTTRRNAGKKPAVRRKRTF